MFALFHEVPMCNLNQHLSPFYATEYLIGLISVLCVVLYILVLPSVHFLHLPFIYLFRDRHYVHLLIPASFPSISE